MQISENSGYRVCNGQLKFQAFDTVQCAQQLSFTLKQKKSNTWIYAQAQAQPTPV